MKAAVLHETKTALKIEELDLNDPGPGEVLVKMMASGVCHSDWHVIKGDFPHIATPLVLGHEGSGIVESTGTGVTYVQPGDHVILSWKGGCGRCEMCHQGWPGVCAAMPAVASLPRISGTNNEINQMVGLGTFGTYTVVPENAVVSIDKDIPFPQAALVGCSVTTGVSGAINAGNVQPGTTVAVFGCGGVGLNVIQGCVIAGATTIIAVDLLDNKLELATQFGATHTVNAGDEDPVEKIIDITGGLGTHYAFEAIGLVEAPFVQSVMCTRNHGVTVWLGAAPADTSVTLDARSLFFDKTIRGSYYGSSRPHVDFQRVLDLYKSGKLMLDELISRTFSLNEVNEAFRAMGDGEVARGVISYE